MATTVKVLVPSKLVENAQTTQYTAVLCTSIIDKCTVTNTSAGNVAFSANLVTAGGSAGASNLVIKPRTITPGETYPCPELVGHALMVGDLLSTLASVVSTLVMRTSGREIT